MVVPFAAGGPNDTIGRIMTEPMRASLGQPVIIENVAGANGTIGVGRVARAAGDVCPPPVLQKALPGGTKRHYM
jgi:putative tricarboxylic transport membrane protein